MAAKVVCTTVVLDLIRILFIYFSIYFSVPATCVRICMLFCSAASGSLYSPAFPVSTSSSLTFTWFSRSRNNLQSHGEISLNNRRLRHRKKEKDKVLNPFFPLLQKLLLFQLLELFLQIHHLIQTFSSSPLAVFIIHLFIGQREKRKQFKVASITLRLSFYISSINISGAF